MKNNYSCLKPKSKRRVSGSEPGSHDTYKKSLKKNRLCLKCGERFLSTGPYNRLCETCASTNEKIAVKTFCVGSVHLEELRY